MRKSTGELQGFEAKDRVWSIRYGWGTVVSVGLIGHGLRVKFDNIKHNDPIFGVFFYQDGKVSPDDKLPSLFFDEVNIEMPKKKLNLKKGDVIEFNTISGEIRVGYFVMFTQNGELLVGETADLRLKLKCLVKRKNFIQKL